jgi:hypothetical protein
MTRDQKIIRAKVGLLELAKQLGNRFFRIGLRLSAPAEPTRHPSRKAR